TNEPISRATVVLLADTDPDRRYVRTVISDSDGRYLISTIPPGAYKVSVSYTGYASPPMKSLILGAGQEVHDVLTKLTQFGVISGRVVSPGGDPISDINVYAQKAVFTNGQRSFKTIKRVQTNDLGEYRLFGLLPGRYFVSAGTIALTVTGDIYPTVYYPNTTD